MKEFYPKASNPIYTPRFSDERRQMETQDKKVSKKRRALDQLQWTLGSAVIDVEQVWAPGIIRKNGRMKCTRLHSDTDLVKAEK